MKTLKLCLALFGVCLFAPTHAADFSVGEFALKVPDSYQGPRTSVPMPRAQAHVFAIEAATVPKPAIMIVMREVDGPAAELKPAEYLEVAKKFAAEMLAATEKRRTEFRATEPREVKLAGRPAVDIAWTGKTNGTPGSGRLFVVATGKAVYFFHAMGAEPPTPDMLAAVEAIEGLRGNR
jgi:hypothetical protein